MLALQFILEIKEATFSSLPERTQKLVTLDQQKFENWVLDIKAMRVSQNFVNSTLMAWLFCDLHDLCHNFWFLFCSFCFNVRNFLKWLQIFLCFPRTKMSNVV